MQSNRIENVLTKQKSRRVVDLVVGAALAIWVGVIGYGLSTGRIDVGTRAHAAEAPWQVETQPAPQVTAQLPAYRTPCQ